MVTMRIPQLTFVAGFAWALASTAAEAGVRYRIQQLPWLLNNRPPNELKEINDARQVAGWSWFYDEWGRRVDTGFVLDLDMREYRVIEWPPGVPTFPTGISDSGTVVGIGLLAGCYDASWLWPPNAAIVDLGDLPGGSCQTQVRAVNVLDQAVGLSQSSNGAEAFLWTPETGIIGLGDLPGGCFYSSARDINDNSWIVGFGCSSSLFGVGFLWRPEIGMVAIDEIVEGTLSAAGADFVNNRNQISGTYYNGELQGYVLEPDGQITLLPWLTNDPTEMHTLLGMSDNTHIVGRMRITGEDEKFYSYFLWDPRRGMHDLSTLLDPCRPAYQLLANVFDVNSDGWILAHVAIDNPSVEHGYSVLIPYIPGDLDEDGVCDLTDLAMLLANFGRTGATYPQGDLDCQGDVDLQDLATLLTNFGDSLP